MGYTTDFRGRLELSKILTYEQLKEYNLFVDTRHEDGYTDKPSIWLQWEIINDGKDQYLEWDGSEKFYNYIEWIEYIIEHFFSKWGVDLNGVIQWRGEDWDDMGRIVVIDNEVNIDRQKENIIYD